MENEKKKIVDSRIEKIIDKIKFLLSYRKNDSQYGSYSYKISNLSMQYFDREIEIVFSDNFDTQILCEMILSIERSRKSLSKKGLVTELTVDKNKYNGIVISFKMSNLFK